MKRKYSNPPIVEAVCEFRFDPNFQWDNTIVGLVYDKIKDDFPKKKQVQHLAVGFQAKPDELAQRVQAVDRMRFLSNDEKSLIQVGPHFLAINRLKPYLSWDSFVPLIKEALTAYIEVAQPGGISRLGLRYINQFAIPSDNINLEDYLTFYPYVGPKQLDSLRSFIMGTETLYENGRDVLKVQLGSMATDSPNASAFSFDLDYFIDRPGAITIDNSVDWIDNAHNHIEDAFESCITNLLRKEFGEES